MLRLYYMSALDLAATKLDIRNATKKNLLALF